jgi:uncharacterized membrane protein
VSREQLEDLTRDITGLEHRLSMLDREAIAIKGDLAALRRQIAGLTSAETAAVAAAPAAVAAAPAAVAAAPTAVSAPPAAVSAAASASVDPGGARYVWGSVAAPTSRPHVPVAEPSLAKPEPPAHDEREEGLEEQVALVWFARIGALVLLCGVGYLYSYAVDRNWISPLGRCILGAAIGGGLIVAAEALRRSTHALYVQVLLGLGLAFLYLSDYAAYGFYSLIGVPAALRLAAAISVLGGYLATRHRSQAVFVFSLLGGFLAPPLLSTGEDRPVALFGYLLALSLSSLVVSLRERFLFAMWIAIAGVQLLFFGWCLEFFNKIGAYSSLPSRWAALVAVTAFLAVSLWVYQRGRDVFDHPTPLTLLVVALLFGHADYISLLYDAPSVAVAAFSALGLIAVFTFAHVKREELLTIPLVAGASTLFACARPTSAGLSLPLILMLVWARVYFVASARALLARGGAPAATRLLVPSLAGLSAVALVLENTATEDALLRAALLAAIALADGALGVALWRRPARSSGNVLIGQALALLVLAAGLALSGSALTLVWALLATLVLMLAARETEHGWLSFGLLVWVVTLARCLFRAATIEPTVELELLGCAAGLFICWATVRRCAAEAFQSFTAWLLTAGHILALWAVLAQLAQWLPAVPDTLILALYATGLVGGGFLFRERHHRYLGLVLFSVTIAKLIFWDVFHQEVLFRVLVLIGVGILLLGASFLYARYGRRLVTLVRDGELDPRR